VGHFQLSLHLLRETCDTKKNVPFFVQSAAQSGQQLGKSEATRNSPNIMQHAPSSSPPCTDSLTLSKRSSSPLSREQSRSQSPAARLDRRSPVLRPIRAGAGREPKLQSSIGPEADEALPLSKNTSSEGEQMSGHEHASNGQESNEVRDNGFFEWPNGFFDKFEAGDGKAEPQEKSTKGIRNLWKFNKSLPELQVRRHASDKLPEMRPAASQAPRWTQRSLVSQGASEAAVKAMSARSKSLSPVRDRRRFASAPNEKFARRSVSKLGSEVEVDEMPGDEQDHAEDPEFSHPIEIEERFAAGGSIPSLQRRASIKFIMEEMRAHDTKTFVDYRTNVMVPGVKMFVELGDRHLQISAADDLTRPIYKIHLLELSVMMRSGSCAELPPFLLFHTKLDHPRQASVFRKR